MKTSNTLQKTQAFVHLHHAMRDLIVCNGLIRDLLDEFEEVTVTANARNRMKTLRMFEDIPTSRLHILFSPSEEASLQRRISHEKFCEVFDLRFAGKGFDREMYDAAGVSFSKRWGMFHVERHSVSEIFCDKETFALIGDFEGKRIGDVSKLHSIRVLANSPIFDWYGLIEKATEIHASDEAFIALVDSIPTKAKLFLHCETDLTLKGSWDKAFTISTPVISGKTSSMG